MLTSAVLWLSGMWCCWYVLECLVGESSREGQSDRKRTPCNGLCVLVEGVVCGDSHMMCLQMEIATHGVALGGCVEVCGKVLDWKFIAAIEAPAIQAVQGVFPLA